MTAANPAEPVSVDTAGLDGVTATQPPAYNPVTQRLQKMPPAQTSKGHYEQQWLVSSLFATHAENDLAMAADVKAKKLSAIRQIDNETDDLYGAVLGNRAEEYTSAANDAQAYRAAGYTGQIPPGVQSWANAKSWTASQATDDILITAGAWINAQNVIRAARLLRKERVRLATNSPGVADELAAWHVFLAYIRKILGVAG